MKKDFFTVPNKTKELNPFSEPLISPQHQQQTPHKEDQSPVKQK
jgi:hypothetical protein